MIYSSRLKKILELCLKRDEYVKVDTLADILKISSRTVFRELRDVDKDLKAYGCSLISKQGKGICIQGEAENKEALLKELSIQGVQYHNKEERQQLLTFELLQANEVEKLIHYANLFQVSEATISNDLDSIAPWFEKQQLSLSRKPGLGVEVHGKEADLRRAMREAMHQSLQEHEYETVNFLDPEAVLKQIFLIHEDSIMKLLNQEILMRVLQVFVTYQHELNLDRYAQTSYIGLIIHLVIAIDRIMKHEEIEGRDAIVSMVQDDPSFVQASQMASYLETEFDIDIPKVEIAFIALHIKGAKTTKVSYGSQEHKEQKQLQKLIEQLLASFDEPISLYLQEDEELYHGLLTHLGPTITRLQSKLPIYNPLLAQIKQEYSALYESTSKACKCLFEEFHCEVSEDEIGFVTMHIGASLERRKQIATHARAVCVGVVCASGIGVSALLSARMQHVFHKEVTIEVLSMDDVISHHYDACEFLISTFVLDVNDKEVILTTPLLNEQDMEAIRLALHRAREKQPLQPIKPDHNSYQRLQIIYEVSEAALQVIKCIRFEEVDAHIKIDELIEQVASHASSEQAKLTMIQDIKRREQLGSIVMKDAGFVLLHAKTKAVEQSQIHLLYPLDSCFHHLDVSFVIVMLLPDKAPRRTQQVMSVFSRSLLEYDAFLIAIKSKDMDQIKVLFSEYCMDLIDACLDEMGDA